MALLSKIEKIPKRPILMHFGPFPPSLDSNIRTEKIKLILGAVMEKMSVLWDVSTLPRNQYLRLMQVRVDIKTRKTHTRAAFEQAFLFALLFLGHCKP